MKTRTCKRCNGTGMKNTSIVHCGIPGLCYGCDGKGVQQWVTAEQITAERKAQCEAHLAEIEEKGAWLKGLLARAVERRNTIRIPRLEAQLHELRDLWKNVYSNSQQPATRGEWRA